MQQFSSAHIPAALATRFTEIAHKWVADGPAERAEVARRKLLGAIQQLQPATLNEVSAALERGAPAVSRSVDALVRAGLVERREDPDNRRRLALRLTASGREEMARSPAANAQLRGKLERLAHSELRAVERAIEIMERGI
ncbi:winged helix-turn-helix transcriptional regulator [Sphingomonas sabuli]|uniref:Winged helix-turn-helix transcriptional regulator n=1 Tax=Sphingomonas sabuli TaxID=2764186 RepID=A0A7G9L4Y3_9SPHN|nr:MarR family winged helix-turn-helix transcriptional regulator [Sphingomonas sabuli]QNM83682.1 winged helix-turn-helix transcriptional regulator [Sphingomonas sabuli]